MKKKINSTKLHYYHCYIHYPGEDNRGKYIFEIYLNDDLISNVLDADIDEGWIRKKIFDEYGNLMPSHKLSGVVKIIKNYNY
ncbi:hypothetical protein EBU71_11395 [bacterium]|jgi:hypothetical protein|nr:hypothetical protein [Candidatus Elulimicrobium humile]